MLNKTSMQEKSNLGFLVKTAYRDTRKNRGKLIMFMSSIVIGIAALVAINSFNYNLVKDIDKQALSLLGADLVMSGNRPAEPKLLEKWNELPGEKSEELELFSMAYIPKVDKSQFVRIKAIKGGFPYYGKILSEPSQAASDYKNQKTILVDDGMLLQYDVTVGDSLKLGQEVFEIGGRLLSVFGSNGLGSSFAPTVYMAYDYLPETGLIQPGSMIDYSYYAKLPEGFAVNEWKKENNDDSRDESMRLQTLDDQKENLAEAFSNLNSFLNLVALVSLLLGCIGVASSVMIYIKSKINAIAVLRCLGMKGMDAFMVYFIQIFTLGLIGVVLGVILGSGIQMLLPMVLSDLLPFEVQMGISWRAIIEGFIIGMIISGLFTMLPLIGIRNISPLRTLRASFEEEKEKLDLWYIGLVGAIIVFLFLFLWKLTADWKSASMFIAGLIAGFIILFSVARLIIFLIRKYLPRQWNFVFRQGLSNLFRPNNQTATLIVALGLGTAVLTMLFVIQGLLLQNVSMMDEGNQPNMVLYGIEKDQLPELDRISESHDLPIIQQVPIVTMRLEAWKGKTKSEWFADTTSNVRRWAANREARVTYRDTMDSSEELIRGTFIGAKSPDSDSIFISLDENYAEGIDVDLGDELIYNVQGTRIVTYVSSIRKIEFRSMATRFFIVFPTGVLEEAPQFYVMVTKSPNTLTTAQYRNEVVKALPNVSVVDLGMILVTLGDILDKVSYVIKFMAGFSILTGLIVLLSSLLLSKYQRIQESVLLRTVGASRNQILLINMTEYGLLGAISALTGIVLALVGSYLLAKFELEMEFSFSWWPIVLVFIIVTLLTVIIGMLNSRDVISKSPLEILRNELA